MEVPLPVRGNIKMILESRMGGLFIENIFQEYQRLMNHPLPLRELGYSNIEAFLRAIPDVARLEYSVRDRRMKVHGVVKFSFFKRAHDQNGQGLLPIPGAPAQKIKMRSMNGDVGVDQGPSTQATDGLQDMKPDHRGIYTLCFPSWQKPMELVGTLEEMFSVAGRIFEVYETSRWIYVCYTDPLSVERAFKMFKHLGLKAASDSALKMDRGRKGLERQKREGFVEPRPYGVLPRKRKRVELHGGRSGYGRLKVYLGPCQRVYVGNLNPNVKYTYDMFRKLFHDFKVSWVSLKSVDIGEQEPITFAYVLAANREHAEGIAKEFNGHVWFGRKIEVAVKEKKADLDKKKLEEGLKLLDSSSCTSFADGEETGDDISIKRGRLENMPGLELAMPGLESVFPKLEPAMPGLEPAMPGLESTMPGLESMMPGLEPAMPGLEPTMPGLESIMPGLEPAMPGLEPSMPGLEPVLPPLEPALPPLEPVLPELEHVPPLENIRVRRSFEVPTVLVTNIRDNVNEAALASLFAVYRPSAIRIVCSQNGRKKAFIELGSVEDVKHAVNNLNQSLYHGLRIKVDVPFNMPELRKAVLGFNHLQATSTGTVMLSEVLEVRGNILQILQLPDYIFHLGEQVEVLITAVISDKFFWGQIVDAGMGEELQKISESLNMPGKLEMTSGPGRCKARFHGDGKWYRAWVMRSPGQELCQQCRVFYLDYGNTAHVPWSHTARTSEHWHWSTPPLAIPFTLIEGVPNLKSRELTRIVVEVNALGNLEEGNMAVVRATSLMPGVKEAASAGVRTVMM